MYHIRNVSRQILNDRVIESAGLVDDRQAKKDIMSILVRARAAETAAAEKGGDATGYRMSDEMLMNQVVSSSLCVWVFQVLIMTSSSRSWVPVMRLLPVDCLGL